MENNDSKILELETQNSELQSEIESLEDTVIVLKAKVKELEEARRPNPFFQQQQGLSQEQQAQYNYGAIGNAVNWGRGR